jgi:hypothetical protein
MLAKFIKGFLIGTIIGFVMVFAVKAFAYDVPQDAVIKVFTKDGKQIGEMSRSKYKVVKIEPKYHTVEDVQMMAEDRKYRESHFSVIFQGGVGPEGMSYDYDQNNKYTITERFRPVVGLTACYTEDTVGLCGTALSNQTGLLGIKKDFNF